MKKQEQYYWAQVEDHFKHLWLTDPPKYLGILTRGKVWLDGEVLTAYDLNREFDNILRWLNR